MKKKKWTSGSIIKIGALIFGLSLLFCSCKREPEISLFQFLHDHELNKVYDQKTVSISEIPDIENYLVKKLPNDSFNRDNTNSGIVINYENILQVIDSLDNINLKTLFGHSSFNFDIFFFIFSWVYK